MKALKPRRAKKSALAQTSLDVLSELLEEAFPDSEDFFNHGLEFLVRRLAVDRAAMTRATESGLETSWAVTAANLSEDHPIHGVDEHLGSRVLDHPERILVIQDMREDPRLRAMNSLVQTGVRSYLGILLGPCGTGLAFLSLQRCQARGWTPLEIVLAKAVAAFFAKSLEVENLREELEATRNILDITTAVVEDSALENPATHLPNRHYLEVWLKAQLYLARRRDEIMAVVQWQAPVDREVRKQLLDISHSLRGEDLLADLGDTCLLLLPRTELKGAEILLERIRAVVGPMPMGATLWLPQHPVDRDDLLLQQAILRSSEALTYSQEAGQNGSGDIQWVLLVTDSEEEAAST